MVVWSVWQLLAYMSRTKSPINTKIGRKVAHLTDTNAHQIRGQKIKGQGHHGLINAKTKSVSPMNFKLGRRLEHALSAAIVKFGYCTRAGEYRVGRNRQQPNLFSRRSYLHDW